MLSWMYWTLPVAIIFVMVFLMIAGMTIWGHYSPPHRRKGFLRIVTDRGERLYIAIITFALIMVASFGIPDTNAWIALGIGAVAAAGVLKWG
jgi:predicted small integral membrane protein